MKDIEILLENKPGALAEMSESLASENINIEGGGVWKSGNTSIAHFLINDADKAQQLLENKNIKVVAVHEIIVLKLKQEIPGQLGKITRLLSNAGINIEVMYSDHYNQLILVVDDYYKAKIIADQWMKNFH